MRRAGNTIAREKEEAEETVWVEWGKDKGKLEPKKCQGAGRGESEG